MLSTENQPEASSSQNQTPSAETTVDLDSGSTQRIHIQISDALSERDKVKYTVQSKIQGDSGLQEHSVIREHEEFVWLHTAIEETDDYAGFIIPPAPVRPDFEAAREKLTKLGESEGYMTKEEFAKMKKELEAEYLAMFKKTVAMHEAFLQRVASHSVLSKDHNFLVFLTYESELCVRGKNRKEKIETFWKRMTQSADEVLLAGQKDVDDFFETEIVHMVELNAHLRENSARSDRVCRYNKAVSDSYMRVATVLERMCNYEKDLHLQKWMLKVTDCLEDVRKCEARACADLDLKQSDTLRYFAAETGAAKELLYRRLRSLANYEAANKALERARAKNKDVLKAEADQSAACERFEKMTAVARGDLVQLKSRSVAKFKSNLIELAQLQAKQAKAQLHLLRTAIATLNEED